MEDHNVFHTLLNIIIKDAFRGTSLKQIGKAPKFFDMQKGVSLPDSGLMMWPGFKASAFSYQSGITLVIDNINKFMSTVSCLDRINEIFERDGKYAQAKILKEFKGKSIVAQWGNKKTYIVRDVIFTLNPLTHTFCHDGNVISVAQYFVATYGLKVKDPKQPLFQVGDNVVLPPEFCTIDGVPECIRANSMLMRNVLA
jgi:hypothetical protein